MDPARALCGSTRMIDRVQILCDRRYAHPAVQKHRAILEDLTVVIWDGATSRDISPRFETLGDLIPSQLQAHCCFAGCDLSTCPRCGAQQCSRGSHLCAPKEAPTDG